MNEQRDEDVRLLSQNTIKLSSFEDSYNRIY